MSTAKPQSPCQICHTLREIREWLRLLVGWQELRHSRSYIFQDLKSAFATQECALACQLAINPDYTHHPGQ
jgi:hypothetical protein